MADDTIGRADYELRADRTGLKKDLADAKADIAKSGAEAEAEATSRSSKWGAALATGAKVGVKAVAVATAGMLGIATKGALELQGVMDRYQADTGATAEEARAAGKVINKVAGDNRLSLQSVADAAAKVRTDLGAVGEEADVLTGKFARYGRVTKQEAGAAVTAFDDILDAWGLTAADSGSIMDKLVVSHQKYGGAVAEDQAALAKLAPTLRAANMDIDDGIAMLDLFKASGVDAQAAVTGLTSALGKVKSPEELQRLIDDISATEDPLLRAQKAADLFGAKAGPKLANALAGKALKDFAIDASEAAGQTDKMNDVLDQSFPAQLQKKISQFGASLRELGTDWGPAVTGAASLAMVMSSLGLDAALSKAWKGAAGSAALQGIVKAAAVKASGVYLAATMAGGMLSDAVASAWSKVAGSSAVMGAARMAGGTIATVFATAATAAIIAAPVAVAWFFTQKDANDRTVQVAAQQAAVQGWKDQGTTVEALRGKLAELRTEGNALWAASNGRDGLIADVFGTKGQNQKNLADVEALIAQVERMLGDALGEPIGRDIGQGWSYGIVEGAADGAAKAAPAAARRIYTTTEVLTKAGLAAMARESRAGGYRAGEAIAQGILAARSKPVDAFNTLREMLKHPMTKLKEQTRLLGELTSSELQKGLRSKDPAIRAQAQATRQYIIDRLTELKTGSGKLTKEQAELVRKGLKSKDPEIRAAARNIRDMVKKPIIDLRDHGFVYGQGFTSGFVRGLVADIDRVGENARRVARVVRKYLQVSSPSELGPFSELGGPEGWSRRWMDLYTKGLATGVPRINGILGGLGGPMSPGLAMAAAAAGGTTSGAAAAGASGGVALHVGAVHISGVGSDVSPAAATRFSRQILDEVAKGFRQGGARVGITTTVRP